MTDYDMPRAATPTIDKTLTFAAWGCMAAFPIPVAPIIGVAIAFVDKGRADPILTSHYRYLIRTFFIGLLLMAVSFLLTFVLIGVLTMAAAVVWYIVRVVKGLIRLSRGEAIENPTTWLV
jgi:uncharacterized membrane protein